MKVNTECGPSAHTEWKVWACGPSLRGLRTEEKSVDSEKSEIVKVDVFIAHTHVFRNP